MANTTADPDAAANVGQTGAALADKTLPGYLHGLRTAIGSRNSAAAWSLLDRPANRNWLNRPAVRALHARLLLADGRAAEAEAACRAIADTTPDGFAGHLPPLCRALIQQGKLAEARDVFADSIWAGPVPPEQCAALIVELTRDCTDAELTAFTARLDAIRPPATTEQSRMAAAEVRAGQYPRAIARLEALERAGPLTAFQKSLLLQALRQLGHVEAALRRVIRWQDEDPDNPQWVLQEAKVLSSARRDDVAIRCTLAGLDRWPLHDGLIKHLSDMPATPDDYARAVDRIQGSRGAEPLTTVAAIGLAAAALHAGRTDLAIDALTGIEAGADLRAVLQRHPPEFWSAARLCDDPRQPVQLVRAKDARATVVVFPGIHQKLGSLPFTYADALLSCHPVNVIYLHDSYHAAFITPAPDIGGSAEGFAAMIRELVRNLDGLPLIALGTSAGGYAAMLHGPAMGAAGIIAYSGHTILHSAQDRPAEVTQHGGLAYLARVPLAQRDVLTGLAARPDLPVWHVAGDGHGNDLVHQRRLAGLSQVRCLIQQGTASHNTLLPAVLSGQFDALLTEAIERAV